MCVSVWVVKVVAPFLLYVCIMCVCGGWNVFYLHQKKSSGHNAGPQQLGFAWFPGLVVGEGLEVPPAVSCFGSVET